MPEPVSLRCPHCQAPLPAATDATRVRCEYCGHVSQLQRTLAPQLASAGIQVAYDVTHRVRRIILVVTLGLLLVIGGVVALVVVKAVSKASEPVERAQQMQQRALQQADRLQREALAQAERLQREAMSQTEEALRKTVAARAEGARRKKRPASPERGGDGSAALPETPRLTAVIHALRTLDVSHCEGPSTVTYGVKVLPDGTTKTTSAGPMKTTGKALGCIREAVETLSFEKSRDGIELKFRFEVGG